MSWKLDLIVYAVVVFLFLIRKEICKKISLLLAVIYSAMSCPMYFGENNYMFALHIFVGVISFVVLIIIEYRLGGSTSTDNIKQENNEILNSSIPIQVHNSESIDKVFASGDDEDFNIEIRTKTGKTIWFRVKNGQIESHCENNIHKQYEVK